VVIEPPGLPVPLPPCPPSVGAPFTSVEDSPRVPHLTRPRPRPRALRRRAHRTTGAVALVGILSLASTAMAAGAGYTPAQLTNIDRPVPAGATLLPNGRLVTPAGKAYDQGDFPLGLAVSPDGRLAVATQVGQSEDKAGGDFAGLCADGQMKGTCAASARLAGATGAPDEELIATDLVTGSQQRVRSPQSSCKPSVAAGRPVQGFQCFELGLTFSPDGTHVYATGGGNDAVYDFAVGTDHRLSAAPVHTTYLQEVTSAPGGSGDYKSPNPGTQAGRTKGIAVTPDGSTLLVTKEQAGALDVLRASDLALVQEVPFATLNPTGANGSATYPYGVAVTGSPAAVGGARVYVTLQGAGSVATFTLTAGTAAAGAAVGSVVASAPTAVPAGDHPTGLAVSPDGGTLLVANANDDTVAAYQLTAGAPGAPTMLAVRALPGEVVGAVPNAVAFAGPDRAYVALAGDDAVAVLERPAGGAAGAFTVTGLVPTGWYPTSVAVRPGAAPGTGDLLALAAKGLGGRYPTGGEYTAPPRGGPQAVTPGRYDGANMPGLLTVVAAPTPAALAAGTAQVRADIAHAQSADPATARTVIPVDAAHSGQSPITHVVYIVRENRTYDQVFGDLAKTRNDVDADPAFESLASATPVAHALVDRFASSDSFFSDGEASIQGHYWTTSANVDDYVEKSWRQYYSDRNHSSDSVGTSVSAPKGCSLFQAAQAKATDPTTPGYDPTFTYGDFGDPVGLANPSVTTSVPAPGAAPGGGAPPAGTARSACGAVPAANADLTNFGGFLGIDDRQFATKFLAASGLTTSGNAVPSGGALRNFSYLELPGDHTTGFKPQGPTNLAGHTPRAQVAENDAAIGTVISALSRSSYWPSTAVFVVEDDSQDGPDHVDGHRNILLVASPYARQTSESSCYPGYVSHVHEDQAGVLRTMELMLGIPPLSAYDAGAAPLYDEFQAKTTAAELTAADLRPFDPPGSASFVEEKVGDPSAGTPAQTAALQRESAGLDLTHLDRAGPVLEDVLWRSTHTGPPPADLTARVAALRAGSAAPEDDAGRAAAVGGPGLRGRFSPLAAGAACTPTAPRAAAPSGAGAGAGPTAGSRASGGDRASASGSAPSVRPAAAPGRAAGRGSLAATGGLPLAAGGVALLALAGVLLAWRRRPARGRCDTRLRSSNP